MDDKDNSSKQQGKRRNITIGSRGQAIDHSSQNTTQANSWQQSQHQKQDDLDQPEKAEPQNESHSKINWFESAQAISGRVSAVVFSIAGAAMFGGVWPVAAVAAGAAGAAMVVDTAIVSNTKSLYKEAKYLNRHGQSQNKQNEIFKDYPNIEKALADELYIPSPEGKSKTKRLSKNVSEDNKGVTSKIKTVAYGTVTVVADVVEGVIARKPKQLIAAIMSATNSAPKTAVENELMSRQRENLRNFIDSERDKDGSPGYDNVYELRKAAREQKIQEMALQKMVSEAKQAGFDLNNMKPEHIKLVFQIKKYEVTQTEKSIRDSNKAMYNARQLGKSIFQAHDKKSKFHKPAEIAKIIPQTAGQEADKATSDLSQVNDNTKEQPKINWSESTKAIGGRIAAVGIAVAGIAALGGAWPVAAAAAGAIATAMVVDTAVVTYTKGLYKEAKYLDRHRQGQKKQNEFFKRHSPNVQEALQNDLYVPSQEGKSKTEKLSRHISEDKRGIESKIKAAAYGAINVTANIIEGIIARNPVTIVMAIKFVADSAPEAAEQTALMSVQRENLRNFIDSERGKDNAPGYDNVYELRKAAREQKIQELALQKMEDQARINGTNLSELSDKNIRLMFQYAKTEVENTEKVMRDSNNVTYNLRQFGKSFFQAHDEKSKFHKPEEIAKLTPKIEDSSVNKSKSKPKISEARQNKLDAINQAKQEGKELSSKQNKKSLENRNNHSLGSHRKPLQHNKQSTRF